MSDHQQGPQWWLASDGKWYPPAGFVNAPLPRTPPNSEQHSQQGPAMPVGAPHAPAGPAPAHSSGSLGQWLLVAVGAIAVVVILVAGIATVVKIRSASATAPTASGLSSVPPTTTPLDACTLLVETAFLNDADFVRSNPGAGSPAAMDLLVNHPGDPAIKALDGVYQRHGDVVSASVHDSADLPRLLHAAASAECLRVTSK